MSEFKHVYILGAGFSLPLGGPLFSELLSSELSIRFKHKFEQKLEPSSKDLASVVNGIPEHLKNCFLNTGIRMNAEQILEQLEDMVNGKENWITLSLMERINRHRVRSSNELSSETVFRLLKVRLALETNWFLEDISPESERWEPYDKWFKSLYQLDTVITTNYDLVLEKLYERRFNHPMRDPGDTSATWKRKPTFARVCKLHGSCDWHMKDGALTPGSVELRDLLQYDVAIGTPGLGKRKLAAHENLETQWAVAKDAIQNANCVSIVGYSLPETDNDLRMMLLDSINAAANNNLKVVNIILGARSERGYRAQSILRQAVRNRQNIPVNLPPVYAQDFLPYYRPTRIDEIESIDFT